jgi:hypothetical protein
MAEESKSTAAAARIVPYTEAVRDCLQNIAILFEVFSLVTPIPDTCSV